MNIHDYRPLLLWKKQITFWEAHQKHFWLPYGEVLVMPSPRVAVDALIGIADWCVNV